jgi:predicted nicotinamide N-methyase
MSVRSTVSVSLQFGKIIKNNFFQRDRASLAVPGTGLALCGVGYDLEDLQGKKSTKPAKRPAAELEQPTNESTEDVPRINEQSRRRKYHAQKVLQGMKNMEVKRNRSVLDAVVFPCIAIDNSWIAWKDELISHDPELLYYPQRLFQFTNGEVLSNQSSSMVGSTIWDAEVLLAHYLDKHLSELAIATGAQNPITVLELGAGASIAAIVLARYSSQIKKVYIQELVEVLPYSLQSCQMNGLNEDQIQGIAATWGDEGIQAIQTTSGEKRFDWIIMADVFYHEEHFSALTTTITSLLTIGGQCIVAFEQRRKDLTPLLHSWSKYFIDVKIIRLPIEGKRENNNPGENDSKAATTEELEAAPSENEKSSLAEQDSTRTNVYICIFSSFQPKEVNNEEETVEIERI